MKREIERRMEELRAAQQRIQDEIEQRRREAEETARRRMEADNARRAEEARRQTEEENARRADLARQLAQRLANTPNPFAAPSNPNGSTLRSNPFAKPTPAHPEVVAAKPRDSGPCNGGEMTSSGCGPTAAPPPPPPINVTIGGNQPVAPPGNSGPGNSQNIPTPCQDLTGSAGCQGRGPSPPNTAGLPSPQPNNQLQQQTTARTTVPVPGVNDLGNAGRTVQELLGTLPDSDTSVPLVLGIPGAAPPTASSVSASSPPPQIQTAKGSTEDRENASSGGTDDGINEADGTGELNEDEVKICQQAFKEFVSGPDSASEKVREVKEFIASFRSFKTLKEKLHEQFKDYVDEHVSEILKKAIEDDIGKNGVHEVEDAKRFNEKLRDCDRAALKSFSDGIDEFLKEFGEADQP
jgi:hypothetical protein